MRDDYSHARLERSLLERSNSGFGKLVVRPDSVQHTWMLLENREYKLDDPRQSLQKERTAIVEAGKPGITKI
ncbi:hypothetical protein EV193_11562 [Herbihabitans rhizosphaerae]|uniref:Uncharacterized protein n=1 Tax=Herbihabitans rhizosphaerae TaxID=1872711 RepID=A0A4V2ERG0_9PSEU|nr:hypothetical protein [Herbihabitans rhizosphaerae]RZS31183.1 hypothetical protein EV193_11562 [Herbihabitans rhizosphaerae]